MPKIPDALNYQHTSFSPAVHHRSDSSTYYTAQWGSPASSEVLPGRYCHRSFSIVSADGSPPRRFSPNRNQTLTPPQIGSAARRESHLGIFGTRRRSVVGVRSSLGQGHSRHAFTENWLENNLSDSKNTERSNWWSDESENSDNQSYHTDSPCSGVTWLPLGGRSPRPGNVSIKQVGSAKGGEGDKGADGFNFSRTGVNQQSPSMNRYFQGNLGASQQIEDSLDIMAHTSSAEDPRIQEPTSTSKAQNTEKPLPPPPPPFDQTVLEAPGLNNVATAAESSPDTIISSAVTQQSSPKARKRVLWRGKACIISLPSSDGRWSQNGYINLLKSKDVQDRLKMWESQGYDTKGFILSSASEELLSILSGGQSRDVYPDPADEEKERAYKNYRVNIPDRQEWEDYVNYLKEDKLRALGVSFGDEEPSTRDSPVLPLMSRHASSQSSAIPLSPPLAASSITNTHTLQRLNPLSMSFLGPTNPVALNSMIYSGPQPQVKPGVSHFARYSVPLPNMEKSLPSPFQFPPAQSPHQGSWSPQQFMRSHPTSRVTSPGVNGHLKGYVNALPASTPSSSDHGHRGLQQSPNNLLPHMRQQQAHIQAQLLQQSHQQQQQLLHPRLLETTANAQQANYKSQLNIITPIPRGHRQNLSETLQKEVDEAESQMQTVDLGKGKTIEYEVDENGAHADDLPVLANILQSADDSDLDTNPSLSNTPRPDGIRRVHNHRSHVSKPSLSKLNVNAPEFVYEPKKSSATDVFAFLGNQQDSKPPPDSAPLTSNANLSKHICKGSINGSSFNVAAPAFTPANATKPLVSSRVFSFSSGGPIFKPDVPNFRPTNTIAATVDPAVELNKAKIFGDIKFSEIVRPGKKSKAIPIIRPQDTHSNMDQDADGQEDESGRITQADGRQKRIRRDDDDGDQIPLFATPDFAIPSQVESIAQTDMIKSIGTSSSIQGDTPVGDNAGNQLEETKDDLPSSDLSSFVGDELAIDADGKPWEPFSFADAEDAAIFNAARPILPSPTQASGDDRELLKVGLEGSLKFSIDEDLPSPRVISSVIRDVEHDSLPASAEMPEYEGSRTLSGASFGKVANDHPSSLGKMDSRSSQSSYHSEPYEYSSKLGKNANEEPLNLALEPPHLDAGPVYVEQSYNEIDAVMKHLNNEDSDFDVERNVSPWTHRSPIRAPFADLRDTSGLHQLLPAAHVRSDAPSPSPNRLQQPFRYLRKSDSEIASTGEVEMVTRNSRFSPSYRPSKASLDSDNPVHRLNSPGNLPVSDWDDLLSSTDEIKFQSRATFFDHRINDLVGGIVRQHLIPLMTSISGIHDSLATLSGRSASRRHRRSTSSKEIEHSDADDEDDEDDLKASESRIMSPVKDRRYDKLKTAITELNTVQQNLPSVSEVSELMDIVKDLKTSMQRPSQPLDDIKTIVQEAVAKQLRGKSEVIKSSHESATVEKMQLQITGLESMLKIADARADDELKARRHTEDALADSQRLLRMAMQEAAEQRESAEETERSLAAFHDERQHILRKTAMLEGAQEGLQKTASDLNEKNTALESTLEEYRLSRSQWRNEVEDAKIENQDLRRTINALKVEIEDSIRGRQTLRTKFDRLQEDMTLASRDIARDQSIWRKREEENKARLEILDARLEAESKIREKLEHEIVGLVAQEREAADVRHALELSQRDNSRFEDLISELRAESDEHQKTATRYECELHDVRESAKLEMNRIRSIMETNIEMANEKTKTVRSELERVVARLQSELDDATTGAASAKTRYEARLEEASADAASAKARYEAMLEEASDSRNITLHEAAEAREAAMQEHYRFHERTLEDLKATHSRELKNVIEEKQHSEANMSDRLVLADEKKLHLEHTLEELKAQHDREMRLEMEDRQRSETHSNDRLALAEKEIRDFERLSEGSKAQHERELKNAVEEKQRCEIYLSDRLVLTEQKILHLEDKVSHLQEKLEIAKAAAQQPAAQSKKGGLGSSANHASISLSKNSDLPEKVSPQALRESIMVLQEQLQEREGRIEQLEQEQSMIDRDAPAKLKDREMEIAWLRELLGVRIDDLEDIITTVSQSSFDRDAVRDAAIRLKANLQMEQQEKERALAGSQSFPSLASVSTLAASPRALPFAAAAAWGNWRRGRDSHRSFGSLSAMVGGSPSQTPSRSSPSSPGFLSGLLTPPGTSIRQTPQQGLSSRLSRPTSSSSSKQPAGSYRTPRQSISLQDESEQLEILPEVPVTPRLMRKASYDGDAESMGFGEVRDDSGFFESRDHARYGPFRADIGPIPDKV